MKRYFVIFFVAYYQENEFKGTEDAVTHGCHPPRNQTLEFIKEQYAYDRVMITNILELNESDFNDWSR